MRAWQSARVNLSAFDLQKQLTECKKQYPWLAEAPSNVLDASLFCLDFAFTSFFRGRGYPAFKKKGGRQSILIKSGTRKVDFEKELLSITRIPDIPIVLSRSFVGEIRTVCVSKTPTGKYYASILVRNNEVEIAPTIPHSAIGIDMGLTKLATLSTGEKIGNPKYLLKSMKRLKALQRRATRKKAGSRNQKKAFRKVAACHERVANQRKDMIQKATTKLIRDNQADSICVESLPVKAMIRNRKLSQSIQDTGWGQFIRVLEYKAKWYGKTLIKVDRFFASSKICSNCGYKIHRLPLYIRQWACRECGSVHDRDINAAINLRNRGLIISGRDASGGPVESSAIAGAMKQEGSFGPCQKYHNRNLNINP